MDADAMRLGEPEIKANMTFVWTLPIFNMPLLHLITVTVMARSFCWVDYQM